MKRLPEFLLGLIGGLIGICMSFFGLIVGWAFFDEGDPDAGMFTVLLTIGFLLVQIAGLVVGCLANRMNNKVFGGIMIGIGVLSFPASIFTMLIPAGLYIAAGAVAFREIKPKEDETTIPFENEKRVSFDKENELM
ncbi:hypothetical protein [Rossellomorea marisflavi]|uniref:hypothetical protein n=1 Tax=Rossellomorea marisflavi TaxID=189381 RepID=UPI00345D8909